MNYSPHRFGEVGNIIPVIRKRKEENIEGTKEVYV